jgi:gluconolactonase
MSDNGSGTAKAVGEAAGAVVVDDPRMLDLVAADATAQWLGGDATWSEGPVYLPAEDAVFWSDIPGNRILRWDAATGEVSTHRTDVEFTNGRTLDLEGRVVACSHGRRGIERTEPDGTTHLLVDRWNGVRFNSPNDVVVKSDGTIWFTDPAYGIIQAHEGHLGDREYGDHYVFRFDPATGEVTPVVVDVEEPNGLAFSPDESLLYVADTAVAAGLGHFQARNHHIRVYDVVHGRYAKNGRVFAEVSPGVADGFRVDQDGNVWTSSADSVQVFAPDGARLGAVPVPQTVGNVCFGGADRSSLFVAATSGLYRIDTRTRGCSPSGLAGGAGMTAASTTESTAGGGLTVGVVGLGVMGAALARRLAARGAHVVATSRSQESRDRVAGTDGVEVVASPMALTSRLAVLVPDGAPLVVLVSVIAGTQVRGVVEGGSGGAGLADGVPVGRRLLVVDTSTCSPADARTLAAGLRHDRHGALDAPVSGGPTAIEKGTLSVMVGGSADDLDAAMPVLDLFAGTVVHCGGPGAGQVTKAANQLLVACTLEAVAEALALAAAGGVDPSAVRTALLGGYAASPVLDLAGDRMVRADFRTVGSVSLLVKDLDIVAALAAALSVDTPAADVVRARVHRLAADAPDVDHAALVSLVAPAGLEALAERVRASTGAVS